MCPCKVEAFDDLTAVVQQACDKFDKIHKDFQNRRSTASKQAKK